MVNRKVDWKYLLMAVIATAFIFGGIFTAGLQLNDYKTNDLRQNMKQIEVEQRSQNLGLELTQTAEKEDCRAMRRWVGDSLPELENLRKSVAAYEDSNKLGGQEETVLKKRYMNLLIQNLIEVRTLEQNCEEGIVDVVYLYADEANCEACEDQGSIITHYRRQYGDRLAVYPLDTELDMKHINFIESYHNVSSYPVLIIDGEVHRGFQSKKELGSAIDKHLNTTKEVQIGPE